MKYNNKVLHYVSGITLSIFIGAHLFNHLVALLGVTAHIQVMNMLRQVYRNPIIEIFLLVVVAIQIVSGVRLVFRRRGKNTSFYQKLQVYSGMYLAFFLIAHTVATVWQGRQVLGLDTNFYYAAIVVNSLPATFFFMPYYFLAVMSVFGHTAAIHYQKTTNSSQAKRILIAGVVVSILILISLNKHYQGIEIPKKYYKTVEGM